MHIPMQPHSCSEPLNLARRAKEEAEAKQRMEEEALAKAAAEEAAAKAAAEAAAEAAAAAEAERVTAQAAADEAGATVVALQEIERAAEGASAAGAAAADAAAAEAESSDVEMDVPSTDMSQQITQPKTPNDTPSHVPPPPAPANGAPDIRVDGEAEAEDAASMKGSSIDVQAPSSVAQLDALSALSSDDEGERGNGQVTAEAAVIRPNAWKKPLLANGSGPSRHGRPKRAPSAISKPVVASPVAMALPSSTPEKQLPLPAPEALGGPQDSDSLFANAPGAFGAGLKTLSDIAPNDDGHNMGEVGGDRMSSELGSDGTQAMRPEAGTAPAAPGMQLPRQMTTSWRKVLAGDSTPDPVLAVADGKEEQVQVDAGGRQGSGAGERARAGRGNRGRDRVKATRDGGPRDASGGASLLL